MGVTLGWKHPDPGTIRLLLATLLAAALGLALAAPGAIGAPPTVVITTPGGGSLSNDATPIFEGTAEDMAAPVTLYVYPGTVAEGTPVQTPSTFLVSDGEWRREESSSGGCALESCSVSAARDF